MNGTGIRYQGYDRIMGNISWLLIALVSLDIKLLSGEQESVIFLAVLCLLLFGYNVIARYAFFRNIHNQWKTFIDLMVFLAFIVAVSWFTGRLTSPFVSLIYLILMATSLTQGRRATYFMAGLAISSYLLLASPNLAYFQEKTLLAYMLELFPFMLIAHLGAMLAGEAEGARQEVERLSLTDELTGLHNMRNFAILAGAQERLAQRYRKRFAMCMVDADNLKPVNDRYGHLAGSELIRHIGRILDSNTRDTDIVARYGGDEFVILFPEAGKEDVAQAVERILAAVVEQPLVWEGVTLPTTLSAGLASFPEDGDNVEAVMAAADEAMYRSKKGGKNRLTLFDRIG